MKNLKLVKPAKFYVPDLPAYPYEVYTAFRLARHLRPSSYARMRNKYSEPSDILAFCNPVGQMQVVWDGAGDPPFEPTGSAAIDWRPDRLPAISCEQLGLEFVAGLKDAPGKNRYELFQAYANAQHVNFCEYIEFDGYTLAHVPAAGPAYPTRIIIYTKDAPNVHGPWVNGTFDGRPYIQESLLASVASKVAQLAE